jgi:hypothetical protein
MSKRIPLKLILAAVVAIAAAPPEVEAQARGGPAFCVNGDGHPVFGWRWCAERGHSRGGGYDRFDDRRYDDRRVRDGGDYDRRNASYERDHAEFHRYLDRKYSDLAARRPLDLEYQVQLRRDRQREHDEWHRRAGVRHD